MMNEVNSISASVRGSSGWKYDDLEGLKGLWEGYGNLLPSTGKLALLRSRCSVDEVIGSSLSLLHPWPYSSELDLSASGEQLMMETNARNVVKTKSLTVPRFIST